MASSTLQRAGVTLIVVRLPSWVPLKTANVLPGLPTDIIQIQSIEVSPDPPKPGQELTVKVDAIVTQTIEVWKSY